ncbi:MAG: hypothetical protein IKV54_04275 [Clostridia bacterium]|nr:hypothetical protein [Clostridia bacterium]
MEKQTKNVITRDFIEKELRFYNTADLRISLLLNSVFLPLYTILIVGLVCGIFAFINNLVLDIIISIVIVVGLGIFPFILLRPLKSIISEKRQLDRGEFDIITVEVIEKRKQTVSRHEAKVLYFAGFEAASVSSTTYDLCQVKDEFYIVHYRGKSTIRLLYPTRMYEFK